MITFSPSWTGEVSIVVRGCPLFRPMVVSLRTGMPNALPMIRPPLRVKSWRWRPKITEAHRNYAGYQKRTDREIPVVILEP